MYFKEPLKSQLAAELRSGKYKQTSGVLRSDGSFCCLGVACRIIDPDGFDHDDLFHYNGQVCDAGLPEGMVDDWTSWTDVSDLKTPIELQDCFHLNSEQQEAASRIFGERCVNVHTLAAINDAGIPFSEIADFIEEHC